MKADDRGRVDLDSEECKGCGACHATPHQEAMTTATARLRVGDAVRSESEQGAGPVDALARALRQCLFALYPAITEIRLRDYRVHTIEPAHGGASRVRVAIDWSESGKRWTTAGVSRTWWRPPGWHSWAASSWR